MTQTTTLKRSKHKKQDHWLPNWVEQSPLFENLQRLALNLPSVISGEWPALAELNRTLNLDDVELVNEALLEPSGLSYEGFIAQYRQIPTRSNWHDFFNAIIWSLFPATKREFNRLHQQDIEYHGVGRTKRRDALTLFDECGVILVCSGSDWQELIKRHQWTELFWQQRTEWGKSIQPFVIGHALYEQAFNAHEGWCGKALVLEVSSHFFGLSLHQQYTELDRILACKLKSLSHPKQLYPLPILGVPGWQPYEVDASYFANPRYFCPAREPSPYLPLETEISSS